MPQSHLKSFLRWSDRWRCQCIMIPSVSKFLHKYPLLQKSLQMILLGLDLLMLFLSIISLHKHNFNQLYYPIYGHFLFNPINGMQSYDEMIKYCHFFDNLIFVEYIGFQLLTFYKIRMGVLILLFLLDVVGILFIIMRIGLILNYIHPPWSNKLYIASLVLMFLFFVLFPSQFCINVGDKCIQKSPIFNFFNLEFMIQYNLGQFGFYSIILIFIFYPIIWLIQQYCNCCKINELFYQIIYFIIAMPFCIIALFNFIMSLWTSSALINIMAVSSIIINYLLYTAIRPSSYLTEKQNKQNQKQQRNYNQIERKNKFSNYQIRHDYQNLFQSQYFSRKRQIYQQISYNNALKNIYRNRIKYHKKEPQSTSYNDNDFQIQVAQKKSYLFTQYVF